MYLIRRYIGTMTLIYTYITAYVRMYMSAGVCWSSCMGLYAIAIIV